MKHSYYNFQVDIDGKHYLYNTISDSFVEISGQILELFVEGRFNNINKNDLNLLIDRHYVIPDDYDEYSFLEKQYEDAIKSKDYFLTLLPTLDCNVHCWYCFERKIKNSRMHKVVKDSIIKHIELLLSEDSTRHFYIELFGGEPLLHFEEDLFPLLNDIQRLIKLYGSDVSFIFVTNGICLTDRNIELLKHFKVNFQISIDGYKGKHDTVKKIEGHENESTYDIVMNNLQSLFMNIDTHVNLRINYDNKTLAHASEVISSLDRIPKNKLTIHLERVWQTTTGLKFDKEQFEKVITDFQSNGFYTTYLNFFHKGYSCKASKINQSVISYNGNVYKCSGRDFSERLQEGILKTDGSIKWNNDKLTERLSVKTYDNIDCKTCKMLPLCFGPCCQKHLEMKDNGKNAIDYCQLKIMELPLLDYIKLRLRNELNKIRCNI